MMSDAVVDRCLEIIEGSAIPTLDITGGAPSCTSAGARSCGALPRRGST
jgi:hypothetical protein